MMMGKNNRPPKAVTKGSSQATSRAIQDKATYRERVYNIVRRIPSGSVMTYGQIAIILGEGYTPRTVGFVMHVSEQDDVPWQRVINSQGACSTGRVILPSDMQQRMLENEGVVFDTRGRCDLDLYRYTPDDQSAISSDGTPRESPSLFRRPSSRKIKPARQKEPNK
jgi:methylated-DNA-protein-cysteine methyltransferase-like protein